MKEFSGTPLAEVFSIVIETDGYKELYGEIRVEDDNGTFCIYDVKLENSETVDQCDNLSLTNKDRAISASDRFTMSLDLWDDNWDTEFIKRSFTWDAKKNDNYDKCLVEKIKGKYGSATMYYTVHNVATEANVVAQLLSADSFSGALDIYGRITAQYDNTYDCDDDDDTDEDPKEHSSMLIFRQYIELPVEMEDEEFLPLTRSVVSVPPNSTLSFQVELWRCLPNGNGELVWSRESEFQRIGFSGQTVTTIIKGRYGVIKLTVVPRANSKNN